MANAADLPEDLCDRIMAQVTIDHNGCWIFNGPKHGKCDYGFIYAGRKNPNLSCHRAMWLIKNGGELGRWDFICHHCDVGPCCNPDHLFKGTLADNNRDMALKGRYNHQKVTHCPLGHPFDEENTTHVKAEYLSPKRRCRECGRMRSYRRYHGLQSDAPVPPRYQRIHRKKKRSIPA